jgi:phenylacetate-CoA ligase
MQTSSGLATLDVDLLVRHSEELLLRLSWSREQLLAHQRDSLRAALRRAVASSPYYKDTFGNLVACDAPLERFPVLTKRALMENFDRIVTDHRVDRVAVERHLDGADPGALLFDRYRAAATGGTTGERGVFLFDDEAWLAVISNIVRFQRIVGVDRTTRSVGIFASSPIHLSSRFSAELRAMRQAGPRLNVLMPIADIVNALNDYQPEVVGTYPSFVRVLANEQLAGRLRIGPRFIRSGAETLTDEIRHLAKAAWQAPVINSYSCTEAGFMAQECEYAGGVHLAEDLFVFEVVDERNCPVADGVRGAKLLVTTLTNRTLPIVRYEISDIVTKATEPCRCGLPFWRIVAIEGRREEVLFFPKSGGGVAEVHAIRLRSPPSGQRASASFSLPNCQTV